MIDATTPRREPCLPPWIIELPNGRDSAIRHATRRAAQDFLDKNYPVANFMGRVGVRHARTNERWRRNRNSHWYRLNPQGEYKT